MLSTVVHGAAITVAWTSVVEVECGRHTRSEYVLTLRCLDWCFPKIDLLNAGGSFQWPTMKKMGHTVKFSDSIFH